MMLWIYSVKTQMCIYVCMLKAKMIQGCDKNGREIKKRMEGTVITKHCMYVKLSNSKISQ